MLGFSKLPSLRTFGVAAFLVVVSLIALAWFYLGGAVRQYEITPSAFSYQFVSDATTGGKTTGNVTVTPDGVVMECDMSPAYVWPYCELAIRLSGDPARGLDVSQFNSLILDASYDSPPGNNGRVRVYLRNYHPAYSTPEDPVSMKFNGIEYSAAKEETRYEFPLDSFQVLTWWIADKKIAPQHAAVDLSNITLIEIATGSGSLPGKYRFELKRLIFEGEWISERELLHALVWLWLGSAVGWMVVHYRELRQQLADSRRQSRLLKKANKALHRESEELCGKVYTDALTGVRNRTDINGWLEKEISSASEKAIPFSLLCIDVDHFKHVNDAYGHPVGDEVLREFAQTIAQQLDPGNLLVRWGGEEFFVFARGRNLAQAAALAEKIRVSLFGRVWRHGEPVTCSIGVAMLASESAAMFLARADNALYRAKSGGRNRVEIAVDGNM